MPTVVTLAYWEGIILLGGFCALISWKLFTGGIDLDQLLDGEILDKNAPDGYSSYSSLGRVQSFLITVFAALFYLLQVAHNPHAFPQLPNALVGVLAGSQGLYLAGKAQAMLIGRLRDILLK